MYLIKKTNQVNVFDKNINQVNVFDKNENQVDKVI